MEQPANSSCFWLGLCLVMRYSIDFLSSVPLPSLRRYAPVLSSHSPRTGERGGESRGRCLCDDTDPNRSHGKGVECESARHQRGIEFARLRLQDEPGIWFRCYTSICYYISGCLRLFVCLLSCMGLLHVWARVMSVRWCLCVSKQLGYVSLMFASIFVTFFSSLLWIPVGEFVQNGPKAILIPLISLPPAILPAKNMVKSNAWSVIISNIFVKT